MPGIVYHLLFAEHTLNEFQKGHPPIQRFDEYILGNILPDASVVKNFAHHYLQSDNQFFVPNLTKIKQDYSSINRNWLRYGVLAHFYLDKRFTEEFLSSRFELRGGVVTQRNQPENSWPLNDFFTYKGLYGAYREINPLIFERGLLNLDWLERTLQHDFPMTGCSILDRHAYDDWLVFLKGRLAKAAPYTGELFTYEEIVTFVKQVADDFVKRDAQPLFSKSHLV